MSKLMKGIFMFVILPAWLSGQSIKPDRYVYPELDKQLLTLWLASQDKSDTRISAAVSKIEQEWADIAVELRETTIPHMDIPEFVSRVHGYVRALKTCQNRSDYSCLVSVSYHLMYEFRSLRQCLYKTEYPIDLLWESMDAYMTIRKTVNDRMFDLKEWFEFEDQVKDMKSKWTSYDMRSIDQIHSIFPGINKLRHNELKQNVNSCIKNFQDAISTGYQDNFILPCDELGVALKELLHMYSTSKVVMLM